MTLTETQVDAVVSAIPGATNAARWQARQLPRSVRDDAVCEALLAVCECVTRYDVTRGSWQTFANMTAKSRVIDFARVWLGREGSKVHGQLEIDMQAAEVPLETRELLRRVVALPWSERVCLIHGAAVGARMLGITVPAAQSRRYRALQRLV